MQQRRHHDVTYEHLCDARGDSYLAASREKDDAAKRALGALGDGATTAELEEAVEALDELRVHQEDFLRSTTMKKCVRRCQAAVTMLFL